MPPSSVGYNSVGYNKELSRFIWSTFVMSFATIEQKLHCLCAA
jgi:hypothetical protein